MFTHPKYIDVILPLPLKGTFTYFTDEDDILVANIRPYLKKIWYADMKGGASADVSVFRVSNTKYDPKYVFYNLFQDSFFDFATKGGKGSKMPRLDKKQILEYPIVERGIEEQEKIANLLSLLDNEISLNKMIHSNLESIVRLTFDYWFMQYDFLDLKGKPYKSSGGTMVYSEELGYDIPESWKVVSIVSLLQRAKNGDWGSDKESVNTVKTYCIRGADIDGLNGKGNFDPPLRYIQQSHSERLIKKNDLIVEISGGSPTQSTGRMAQVSEHVIRRLDGSIVCSNFCKAISLKNELLSFVVEQYWMKLYESGIFFNHEGKTSGIKNLMFDQLVKDVKIALPPSDMLIEKFYDLCASIDEQKQAVLEENQKITRLRDWLLPMLLTGQVKVTD